MLTDLIVREALSCELREERKIERKAIASVGSSNHFPIQTERFVVQEVVMHSP